MLHATKKMPEVFSGRFEVAALPRVFSFGFCNCHIFFGGAITVFFAVLLTLFLSTQFLQKKLPHSVPHGNNHL